MEWGKWCEDSKDRFIEQTDLEGDVRVSTVFLGIDHNFHETGRPILFETMIFGGEHDQYQTRCATYTEAKKMHTKALWIVRGADVKETG